VQPHTDTGTQNQHFDAVVALAALQAAQLSDEPQTPRADKSLWGEAGDSAEIGVEIGARHSSSIANPNRPHVSGSAVNGEACQEAGLPTLGEKTWYHDRTDGHYRQFATAVGNPAASSRREPLSL
jgi:hypothetical protein